MVVEWPPEDIVVKIEEKKDDGDENANADKKDDADKEEEEKKFNPKEFVWTSSSGNPKSCSQIYNKMKPAIWVINEIFKEQIGFLLKIIDFFKKMDFFSKRSIWIR